MTNFLKLDSVLSLLRGILCLTWMSLRGAVVSRGGDEVKGDPPLVIEFFPRASVARVSEADRCLLLGKS